MSRDERCPLCGRTVGARQQTIGTLKSYTLDTVFHLKCWEKSTAKVKEFWSS